MAYDNLYEPASGLGPTVRNETIQRRQSPLDALREIFGQPMTPSMRTDQRNLLSGFDPQPTGSMPWGLGYTDPQWTDEGSPVAPLRDAANRRLPPVTVAQDTLKTALDAYRTGMTQIYGGPSSPFDYEEAKDTEWDRDYLQSAYERAKALWEKPINAKKEAILGDYGARLAQLEAELAGYQGALGGVNAAYASYADDANAILSEAAAVEADPLDPTGVVEEVDRTYSDFDGEMQKTLQKIDSNGDVALAQAMTSEITRMKDIVMDGLRSDLATQDDMHRLAGTQAQALANMAWKDDLYQAERQRFQLELEINQQINNQANDIGMTRDEMNRRIAAIDAESGSFVADPDELWSQAMMDLGRAAGLTDVQVADLGDIWANLIENPDALGNYNVFKQSVSTEMWRQNLTQLGILGQVDAYTAQLADAMNSNDPEAAAQAARQIQMINGMYSATNVDQFADLFAGAMSGSGLTIPIDVDTSSWATLDDPLYKTMLDLWGHHGDFLKNYDSWVQTAQQDAAITTSKGRQAPNNYENRYQPAYRHRREVWAPQFAQMFNSIFGSKKVDGRYNVGGLGYLRPPTRGAANSDHQSGGAVDLYGTSFEQLKRIEQWAKSQPGVSMVIYSGRPDHETGNLNTAHVHVSLQLGYGWNG